MIKKNSKKLKIGSGAALVASMAALGVGNYANASGGELNKIPATPANGPGYWGADH